MIPKRNVLPNRQKLTEEEYLHLQSKTLLRLSMEHGQQRVAVEATTTPRTIRNSTNNRPSMMNSHFLFNLLTHDITALDDIMAHFGLTVAPMVDAASVAPNPGQISPLAEAVAAVARVTHPASEGGVAVTDAELMANETAIDDAGLAIDELRCSLSAARARLSKRLRAVR